MKLSEAILMGRHLVTPKAAPYPREEEWGNGCALTMAAKAVGLKHEHDTPGRWPWLSSYYWDITGKFDLEVMRGTMTL